MIGERVDGWRWAQASGLSLGLHAALLAYLIYQPTLEFLYPDPAMPLPQIEVTSNDATTFKPFSPNEVIGNTAPSLPYIQPPSSSGRRIRSASRASGSAIVA